MTPNSDEPSEPTVVDGVRFFDLRQRRNVEGAPRRAVEERRLGGRAAPEQDEYLE